MPLRSSILDVQCLALTVKLPVYYRHEPELFFISHKSQTVNTAPLSLILYTESPSKYHSFIRSQRGCCGCWFTPSSPLLLTRSSAEEHLTALSDTSLQTFKVHSEIHLKSRLLFGTHSCWSEVDIDTVVRNCSW